MKRYCLGFIFDHSRTKVLLVHKLAPDWQRGKLNGIGGKLEDGETSLAAMVRETAEESGVRITESSWRYLGEMMGPDWYSDVFGAVYMGETTDARQMDKEAIEWFSVQALPNTVISNLRWLIPLALDVVDSSEKQIQSISVRYQD